MWATPVSPSEPVRAFLSLNHRADSLPEAAVCVRQVVGFVLGEGAVPGKVPWDTNGHFALLGKGPSVNWLNMSFSSSVLWTRTSEAPMLLFPEA